jgi:ABC-type microcin C transport system permease subunit YejE
MIEGLFSQWCWRDKDVYMEIIIGRYKSVYISLSQADIGLSILPVLQPSITGAYGGSIKFRDRRVCE